MQYTLKNNELTIIVESFGAQVCSVKQGGKEWFWQNPTGSWKDHSPILFPVCGWCRCTVNGVEYPISKHGFGKNREFTVAEKGEDYITLALQSDEETKKVYPFDFIYRLTYRVQGLKLCVEHTIENTGKTPLYFACGGHESFNLQTNVDDYVIEFEKEEKLVHHCHGDKGGMIDKTIDYGTGKMLVLPRDFLQNGNTLIFPNIQSRKVWLCEKNGKRLAEISFAQEFENLLLWRAKDDPFICIEPWTNVPDAEETEDIEFSLKKGTVKLEVGQTKTLVRSVEYK